MRYKSWLMVALSVLLMACDRSSSSSSAASQDAVEVSGQASAPSGSVAMLETQSVWGELLSSAISTAYAGIIGLDPIQNALVELIRVDDNGQQVGGVLATTFTSITGDYTLTLPTGVSLAGNLIVRITGNGSELRAQVVEQEVDISPVSEFILQKFIQEGTPLSTLPVDSVVKISNKVEEFDLTATNDISSMLAALESEVGEFIENQITDISSSSISATLLTGDYRGAGIQIALHDGFYGTYGIDYYVENLSLSGSADGDVDIISSGGEGVWAYVHGIDASNNYDVYYSVDINEEVESFSAVYKESRTISFDEEFEEDIYIDDDSQSENYGTGYGWRSPPQTVLIQRAVDSNVLFHMARDNFVRYNLIDTDGDNYQDAVNPNSIDGYEASRGITILAQTPTDMQDSDLTGDFGRVYLGTYFDSLGTVEVETESNVLTFAGNGTVDSGETTTHMLSRSDTGLVAYTGTVIPQETALGFQTTEVGDISHVDGSEVDGFVSADYKLWIIGGSVGTNGSEGSMDMTIAVKLPTSTTTVANKVYKLMFVTVAMSDQSFALYHPSFSSTVTFSSDTAATLSGDISEISLANLGNASLETTKDTDVTAELTSTIESNGAAQIISTDEDGTFTMTGYFNETASIGIFETSFVDSGNSDPSELGMALLIEVE